MRNDTKNLIVDLSLEFALEIVSFSESLRNEKKFELASQLFRSGTSIGANIREAQNAESEADFVHKFKIAAKEADETQYWLLLCEKSEFLPSPPKELHNKIESIIKIITKIVVTTRNRKIIKS